MVPAPGGCDGADRRQRHAAAGQWRSELRGERDLAKVEVAGSKPVSRSIKNLHFVFKTRALRRAKTHQNAVLLGSTTGVSTDYNPATRGRAAHRAAGDWRADHCSGCGGSQRGDLHPAGLESTTPI